ncbi:unnamed protein product [Owenia fusiformis]|uniref:Uncharacterized protein n=1 Tax=Owenia fusiformis TaxID=6347 RepID=A0A8J1XQS5_OWEFU|nr:unnamed protein product [Owenia fusiformis]
MYFWNFLFGFETKTHDSNSEGNNGGCLNSNFIISIYGRISSWNPGSLSALISKLTCKMNCSALAFNMRIHLLGRVKLHDFLMFEMSHWRQNVASLMRSLKKSSHINVSMSNKVLGV